MQANPHLENLPNFQRELLRLGEEQGIESCVELTMEVVTSAVRELAIVGQRLRAFLGGQYGRKSEKIVPGQPLFDFMLGLYQAAESGAPENEGAEPSAPADDVSEPDASAADQDGGKPGGAPPAAPKKRSARGSLLDLPLPRVTENVLVPEEQRQCACGRACITTGFRRSASIEVVPARAHLRVQEIEQIACTHCVGGVTQIEPTGIVKPGFRAGPTLLAHLATTKVADGCPVYRQREFLARGGLELADSTADEYFAAACDLAEPISKLLRLRTISCLLLSTDDTRLLALGKVSKGGTTNGRLWCMLGDIDAVGFCRFTVDWKQSSFAEHIKGFHGVLQGDWYAGYRSYARVHEGVTVAGCMDHCRRRFVEAIRQGDARAGPVLAMITQLYKIEAGLKRRGADVAERFARRQQEAIPILARIERELVVLETQTLPRTLLADAVGYAQNQWAELCAYASDGRIPISNAHVERSIKLVALLRKNSMFAGSVDGAKRLGHMLTLVLNCRLAKVCPFTYMSDVFRRLVDGWPASRISELTPQAWALTQQSA